MTTKKTIVTAAVTGASLTPSMSKFLPVSPEQIVADTMDAFEAGAAVTHLHAREPNGFPTNAVSIWQEIVPPIRAGAPNGIVNMSASFGDTAEDRCEAVLALRPDIATVIVGSMNYGLFRKAENQGVSRFDMDWEKEEFGPKAYEIVTHNSFATIDRMISILIDHDIGIEFEAYDVGDLYTIDYHLHRKNVKRPLIVQFLTGILGGIPSEVDHLLFMKRNAERLFGSDAELFTHGTGLGNVAVAIQGALMGTHVRVGMEDNLFEFPGVPYKSSADQVRKLGRVLGEFGLEMASPTEAKQILAM